MIEVCVLGPLEVRRDGEIVPVPGTKPRTLLLARWSCVRTSPSRGTGWSRLCGADDPPPRAGPNLHVHVATLRKVLNGDPDVSIDTSPGAYTLRIPPERIDANGLVELDPATGRVRSVTAASACMSWPAVRSRRGLAATSGRHPGPAHGHAWCSVGHEPWRPHGVAGWSTHAPRAHDRRYPLGRVGAVPCGVVAAGDAVWVTIGPDTDCGAAGTTRW